MNATAANVVPPHETAILRAKEGMLIDDVTQIVQRVPFIEVAPARLFTPGLVAELADAVDRLAVKVGKLQEALGADR